MTPEQSAEQLVDLFLRDPETGADLVFCSPLEHWHGDQSAFVVMNAETGEKRRVIFTFEEA